MKTVQLLVVLVAIVASAFASDDNLVETSSTSDADEAVDVPIKADKDKTAPGTLIEEGKTEVAEGVKNIVVGGLGLGKAVLGGLIGGAQKGLEKAAGLGGLIIDDVEKKLKQVKEIIAKLKKEKKAIFEALVADLEQIVSKVKDDLSELLKEFLKELSQKIENDWDVIIKVAESIKGDAEDLKNYLYKEIKNRVDSIHNQEKYSIIDQETLEQIYKALKDKIDSSCSNATKESQ